MRRDADGLLQSDAVQVCHLGRPDALRLHNNVINMRAQAMHGCAGELRCSTLCPVSIPGVAPMSTAWSGTGGMGTALWNVLKGC